MPSKPERSHRTNSIRLAIEESESVSARSKWIKQEEVECPERTSPAEAQYDLLPLRPPPVDQRLVVPVVTDRHGRRQITRRVAVVLGLVPCVRHCKSHHNMRVLVCLTRRWTALPVSHVSDESGVVSRRGVRGRRTRHRWGRGGDRAAVRLDAGTTPGVGVASLARRALGVRTAGARSAAVRVRGRP